MTKILASITCRMNFLKPVINFEKAVNNFCIISWQLDLFHTCPSACGTFVISPYPDIT